MKHKFTDSLTRKLSWDRHPFAKDPRDALKRIIERHSLYGASSSRSRFVNPDSPFSFDGSSRRSDADDGHARPWFHNPLKSQIDDIFNQWTKHATKGAKQAKSDFVSSKSKAKADAKADARSDAVDGATSKGAQEDDGYVFDPITNRKIPRDVYESSNAEHEGPVRSFKSYRSQFAPFAPPESEVERPTIHSDGPPPTDELRKYGQVDIDPNPTNTNPFMQDTPKVTAEELKAYEFPTTQSDEYSLNHLPPDEPNETYDDLHKYKPYMHNEPTGSLEEDVPKYDDLHKYKPYMYNEDVVVEDNTHKYTDLDKYGPYMYKEDMKAEESSPMYDDLDKYGPYMYKEDMKPEESSRDQELEKYGPYMYNEDLKVDDGTLKYDDLAKYHPTTEFEDPTSTATDQPFYQYGDLDKYKMFRHQEPDGKPAAEKDVVAECLNEYDAKMDGSESKVSKPSIAERLQKLDLTGAESQVKGDQLLKTDMSKPETTSRDDLEVAMDNHHEASDAADREAFASVQELRSRQEGQASQASKPTMTGNYVRDFPEEFTQSWGNPAENSTFQPTTAEAQSGSETASRLETALERHSKATAGSRLTRRAREEAAEADSYSKEPQGLETSYAEECGGKPTWPTFVKTYSTNKDADADADADAQKTKSSVPDATSAGLTNEEAVELPYSRDPEVDGLPPRDSLEGAFVADSTAAAPGREPTVYKILAYDPTTQKITTAETASVVPDDEAPLTPAEVLLRLSNPTQFLPHFAPLQAEGFEIASGAGDVLVFRKVREQRDAKGHQQQQQPPVNPIDMMGRPAPLPSAAAFASPTGFLNYDLPPASAPAPTTAEAEDATATSAATTTAAASAATAPHVDQIPTSEASSPSSGFENTNFVKREEPVFSGVKRIIGLPSSTAAAKEAAVSRINGREEAKKSKGKREQQQEEKKEKVGVGRRMLVAGAWVAGISYTLGVVGDYFITGGIDGRGPIGF